MRCFLVLTACHISPPTISSMLTGRICVLLLLLTFHDYFNHSLSTLKERDPDSLNFPVCSQLLQEVAALRNPPPNQKKVSTEGLRLGCQGSSVPSEAFPVANATRGTCNFLV